MTRRDIYHVVYGGVREWLEFIGETIEDKPLSKAEIRQAMEFTTYIEIFSEKYQCIITSESMSKGENVAKLPKQNDEKKIYVFSREARDLSDRKMTNISFEWLKLNPFKHMLAQRYEIIEDQKFVLERLMAERNAIPKAKYNIDTFWAGANFGDIIALYNDRHSDVMSTAEYRIVVP
jgi:DNA-directed RNA polymerase subunit H (RpoH/RPB5)